ncbi:MAG TPA: methylamine utilization protein [Ignavibacteriaceae bacterium]|nr:methylamine utilization protein [Ignavibacteriaceae bacterium]
MENSIKIISSKHSLKSIFILLTHYLIAGVLLFSGVSKIIYPENILNVLNITLNFLGEDILMLIAALLPVIEIALGTMILMKIKVKETLITTLILFSGFVLFAGYGFIAGFDVDCGCFGTVIKNEFGIWMILRNILLVLIAYLNLKYFNERNTN